MNKVLFLFIWTVFVAGIWAAPSWADTDYLCLDSCIKAGKASAVCLPQCTHDGTASHQQSETDYRCLSLCANGGKSASACLAQCTYIKAPANAAGVTRLPPPAKAEGAWASSHDVLQAPVPAGDTVLITPPVRAATNPDKNYGCITQCLHDGMQYDMCNQNCAAVTPEFNSSNK